MSKFSSVLNFFRRKPVAIGISFLITGGAVWIALRGVDLRSAGAAIASMKIFPLFVALMLMAVGTFLRALRWHVLMHTHNSTLGAAVEAVLIATFFTGVLPLRTGEVVRIGYFARRTGAPVLATTGALVLERTLDLATLAMFAAIFLSGAMGRELPGLKVPPWALGTGAGVVVVALIGAGFWLAWRSRQVGRPEPKGKLAKWFNEGLGGLASLESKPVAALVLFLSLFMWFITMLPGIWIFRAMGLDVPLSDVVIITLGTAFAIAAPAAPGFVGTFHAGFVLTAKFVGIDKDVALPAAVVTHLMTQIPFILAGGAVLATGGRKALAKGAGPV